MENGLINAEISNRIYTIRDQQVMLDRDLAELYNILTGNLNKAVQRNIDRFPPTFMFQLTEDELDSLIFQNGISNNEVLRPQNGTLDSKRLRSQIATSKNGRGGRRHLPYAFTEQGVAMLSAILKSRTAILISVQIINAFVVMRRFIASNAQVFQRLDRVEVKQLEHNRKFDEVFDAIESKGIKPEKGIFFDGQVFDSYKLVSDIIRTAKISIVLVDNYIDDSVLALFSKRNKDVRVTIFTKDISRQLSVDLAKCNSQYPPIEVKEFGQSHDRFLIIDNKEMYHLGASLKDLGKKWFAFSRFDREAFSLLERLGLE
ncbi:MAG: ORF6N domain-containing protein [Candidatus Woesearchaeota archaeon]